MFKNVVDILFKKEYDFVEAFIRQMKIVNTVTSSLDTTFFSKENILIIKQFTITNEKLLDQITDEIIREAHIPFSTPFSRSDIRHLANSIDDIVDSIKYHLEMYTARGIFLPYTDEIDKIKTKINIAATHLAIIMPLLNDINKCYDSINHHIKNIKDIENEVDQIFKTAIYNIWHSEMSVENRLLSEDYLKDFEKIMNKCEKVADNISVIVESKV